jgi:NAD(P)-dependent dehydrogenase (short-subunit alcohol dehydrogenase family)
VRCDAGHLGHERGKNDAAVGRLSALGVKVHAVACDVGGQDSTLSALSETLSELGRVDSCLVDTGVIAVEFAPFKVRSNAFTPGLVDTEMSSKAIRSERFATP